MEENGPQREAKDALRDHGAAQSILGWLASAFPGFAEAWNGPDNCFVAEDGAFTVSGLFAEFSHYFRSHYEELPPSQIVEVGRFVSDCAASSDAEIRDGVATCFLENVATERFHSEFKRYLSGEALRFYSTWDKTP